MKRFRLISWLEGISFLALLFVAMPLKYMADMPMAVRVVGMVHGVLFVAYIAWVLWLREAYKMNNGLTFKAIAASMLPFGMVYVDKQVIPKISKA